MFNVVKAVLPLAADTDITFMYVETVGSYDCNYMYGLMLILL